MALQSPFPQSSSQQGHGTIKLAILLPSQPVLQELVYQYPLKLIAPPPILVPLSKDGQDWTCLVYTVFLLSYGGGLVGGDSIDLKIDLASHTRLVLLTQGSTKIFKAPKPQVLTTQVTKIHLQPDAALCWLPDPVQPFADSSFKQTQCYELLNPAQTSICVLDWVCEGRRARGEQWSFFDYSSCNEIWSFSPGTQRGKHTKRLLLRDNLVLNLDQANRRDSIRTKMHDLGCFGTLILGGPLLHSLGEYFLDEFKALPRIGNKQWDMPVPASDNETRRAARVARENIDGVLWTAAAVRGFVVVKFGAAEPEGGKRWLANMLVEEGTIESEFGAGCMLCLR